MTFVGWTIALIAPAELAHTEGDVDMFTFTARTFTLATVSLGLLTLLPIQSFQPVAMAQKADETYVAVITGDDVYVRSGPSDSYYPFSKLSSGALVQVMGEKILDEKSRWVRVATTGPAFVNAFGYIRYAKADTGKVRVSDDGQSAVTLGRVDVIAPNMDMKGAAKDSWKPLVRLEADQGLRVLEKMETDKDTILKVALPEGAQGWVTMSFVRKADTTEAAQFKASLSGATIMPPTAKPTDVAHAPTPVTPTTDQTKTTMGGTDAGSTGDTTTTDTSANKPIDVATDTSTTPTLPTTIKPAPTPHLPTLDELEGAYKLLQKEKIETAEVIPLREMYLDLGKRNPGDKRIIRYVSARTDQLQVWADLQKSQQELAAMRGRLTSTADEAEAVRKALESSAQYTAVGRIAASTIYDGEGLPKLLRLQDGSTGRTVAYLLPDEEYKLVNLIGNLVGIVGEKNYDGSLRLNIITPSRIDILTTVTQTQAVSAETLTPAKP